MPVKITIPVTILKINQEGCHLLVHGWVNSITMNLLIDTGASQTVFDINRIKPFVEEKKVKRHHNQFTGIGTQKIITHDIYIDRFKIGEFLLKGSNYPLIDLKSINDAYKTFDLPRIDGVIGGDILLQYNAEINYQKRQLLLESENL